MYHPLGINVRVAKKDTCLPVGGGPDGTQPVAVLKGEQISTFSSTYLLLHIYPTHCTRTLDTQLTLLQNTQRSP